MHEQQVLLKEFLSSSQLASAYEGIWKSLKLCFNVAVAHHVSIICVREDQRQFNNCEKNNDTRGWRCYEAALLLKKKRDISLTRKHP
jgi:hypothetical protein